MIQQLDLPARVRDLAQQLAALRKKECGQMNFGNCLLCNGAEHAGPCDKPVVLRKSDEYIDPKHANDPDAKKRIKNVGGEGTDHLPKPGKDAGKGKDEGSDGKRLGKEEPAPRSKPAKEISVMSGGAKSSAASRMLQQIEQRRQRAAAFSAARAKSKDSEGPGQFVMTKAEAHQASAHHLHGLNEALVCGDQNAAARHARLGSIYERLLGGDPQKGWLPETEALAGQLKKGLDWHAPGQAARVAMTPAQHQVAAADYAAKDNSGMATFHQDRTNFAHPAPNVFSPEAHQALSDLQTAHARTGGRGALKLHPKVAKELSAMGLIAPYRQYYGANDQRGVATDLHRLTEAGVATKFGKSDAFKPHRLDDLAERMWKASPGAMLGMAVSTPPVAGPKKPKPQAPGSLLATIQNKVFGPGKTAGAAPPSASSPAAQIKPPAAPAPASPAGGAPAGTGGAKTPAGGKTPGAAVAKPPGAPKK